MARTDEDCPDCGGDCLRTMAAEVRVGVIPGTEVGEDGSERAVGLVVVILDDEDGKTMAHRGMTPEKAREMSRALLEGAMVAERMDLTGGGGKEIKH